jgi:hypothetical protein
MGAKAFLARGRRPRPGSSLHYLLLGQRLLPGNQSHCRRSEPSAPARERRQDRHSQVWPAAGPLEALQDTALSVLGAGGGPTPAAINASAAKHQQVTSQATGGATASLFRCTLPEGWSRYLLRRGRTGRAVPGTGATDEASTPARSRPPTHPHRLQPRDSDSGIGATGPRAG